MVSHLEAAGAYLSRARSPVFPRMITLITSSFRGPLHQNQLSTRHHQFGQLESCRNQHHPPPTDQCPHRTAPHTLRQRLQASRFPLHQSLEGHWMLLQTSHQFSPAALRTLKIFPSPTILIRDLHLPTGYLQFFLVHHPWHQNSQLAAEACPVLRTTTRGH